MTMDYTTLENELEKADCDFSVSFVHGLLSAYVCADELNNRWVFVLFSDVKEMDASLQEVLRLLEKLKQLVAEQLADSDLTFQLLLREDNQLSQQALDTREWVSGFLLGIEQNQLKSQDDEVREFIKDLSTIASMPLLEDGNEEDLSDLIEIQEYCRLGVINLYLTQGE